MAPSNESIRIGAPVLHRVYAALIMRLNLPDDCLLLNVVD
jgi:hypothetical protein